MGGPVDQTRGREATSPLTLTADGIFSFLDIQFAKKQRAGGG